jgi:hypothetical protein
MGVYSFLSLGLIDCYVKREEALLGVFDYVVALDSYHELDYSLEAHEERKIRINYKVIILMEFICEGEGIAAFGILWSFGGVMREVCRIWWAIFYCDRGLGADFVIIDIAAVFFVLVIPIGGDYFNYLLLCFF